MFTLNDTTYDFHFNRDRLKIYENRTGKAAMAELVSSEGMLPIASVESYFAVGLVDTNNRDVYVPAKKAIEIADAYMDEYGYAAACSEVFTALQRDLPFLFRRS